MASLHMQFNGPRAEEVTRYVGKRLIEMKYQIKQPTDTQLTLEMIPDDLASDETKTWRLSPHDPVDFAGEKVLDDLEALNLITLEQAEVSGEDEEAIRQRLQDLGYIE